MWEKEKVDTHTEGKFKTYWRWPWHKALNILCIEYKVTIYIYIYIKFNNKSNLSVQFLAPCIGKKNLIKQSKQSPRSRPSSVSTLLKYNIKFWFFSEYKRKTFP